MTMTDEDASPRYDPSKQEGDDIANRFTHHPPTNDQIYRYGTTRTMAHNFAAWIINEAPPSRERALALTHLEEVVMWANASIARNEKD